MEIENNILAYYLRNVYLVGGNACAGKSTLSKHIAKEYGFALYQMDERHDIHRSIANATSQPNMCYPRDDIYAFFNRPVLEYADSLQQAIREQVPMVLMDLIALSQNQPVVADVLFTPLDIQDVIPKERAVFLTSNEELVRADYFNRPEKRAFWECIQAFPRPEKSFENVINVVNEINRREQQIIRKMGYYTIARTKESQVEQVLQIVEAYWGLK